MHSFYFKWLICVFLLMLTVRFSLSAQEDTTLYKQLSGVEVVEKLRPSVTRETTPLQVMTKSAFERLGTDNLAEAMKRFSGISVQDYGGIGGLKTISVRSLGAKHTAVAYDGVTLTNAQSGQVDIGRFSLDNIDQVSLAIGQSDDIFQTARLFASAGALNMQTVKPAMHNRPARLMVQFKGGSFGWINPVLRYEQHLGTNYCITLDGNYQRADGRYPYTFTNGSIVTKEKRSNSDIESYHGEVNLYADWQQQGNLQLKGYWFWSDRGLPGSVILYNDYHTERLKDKNGFMQAQYNNRISDKLATKAFAKFDYSWTRYRDYHSRYIDGIQQDVYTQREYYASSAWFYTPAKGWSVSLAEDIFYNMLDATTPKCVYPERFTSLTSLAAQYQNSRLTVTGSLLNTFITEKLKTGDPAPNRNNLAPAISISYRVVEDQNLRVRASYKHSYRMPTFNDLYYDRIGNRDLDPEKAIQYNAGVTWSGTIPACRIDYLSLTVDGYYNHVKDKIVAIPTMFIWKMMNMGKVNISGIDANLSAHMDLPASCALLLDANYTWQRAIDRTDKDSKIYGDQIPYTPEHTGTVALSFENPWVNFSWSLNAVGKRYVLLQPKLENKLDGLVEQQISANREFRFKTCSVRLQADVLNLGNATYAVIRYYPLPGRSFRGRVRFV